MRRCCPQSREPPPYRNDELAAFRYGHCTLRASIEEIGAADPARPDGSWSAAEPGVSAAGVSRFSTMGRDR
jgi:hypothetical protein